MKAYLISRPTLDFYVLEQFHKEEKLPDNFYWINPGSLAELLVEICGRLCYMSFGKGRKSNEEFLKNIIESKHFSVLEHANYTFLFTGVSRSLTHELVRHRHFSFSQLSQRYVDESEAKMILPSALETDTEKRLFEGITEDAKNMYKSLVHLLEARFAEQFENPTLRRKAARQAARAVLPNATETKIAVTGNARTWREFIQKRNTPMADPEIRALAAEVYGQLKVEAPFLFYNTMGEEV